MFEFISRDILGFNSLLKKNFCMRKKSLYKLISLQINNAKLVEFLIRIGII